MSATATLLFIAGPILTVWFALIPTLRPLRPLFDSSPHVRLDFPGSDLVSTKANAVLAIFILRAVAARLSSLIGSPTKPRKGSQSVNLPFRLSSQDLSTYLALVEQSGGGEKALPRLGENPHLLQLFVASLASPCIVLLLAKGGVDVDALGSVNVRNTFHSLSSTELVSSLTKALDKPNALQMKATVDMGDRRKVKRGWEFDVLAELLEGDKAVFRMTFTTLAMARHASTERIQAGRQEVSGAEYQRIGQVRVNFKDVDRWVDLSKDSNPIHTSHLLARGFGLKGRIAHGNLVVAKALAELSRLSNGQKDGDLEAEFLRPVLLPASLEICEAGPGGSQVELRSKGKPLVTLTYRK